MSFDLDALLVDPKTHEPVSRATDAQLQALRQAAAKGTARRADGGPLPSAMDGAYLTQDRLTAYPVLEGIPCFLLEERIELETALPE